MLVKLIKLSNIESKHQRMPEHIRILHYNYTDDKVFIYTPPTGESIDSDLRQFLIDQFNKLASDFIKKAKIIRRLQYSEGDDQSDKSNESN